MSELSISATPKLAIWRDQDELLARAKHHADAGDRAGNEHYRQCAEALIATWKAHKTAQREMAEGIGRSQTWVSLILKWHREGCPELSPFAPVERVISDTNQTERQTKRRTVEQVRKNFLPKDVPGVTTQYSPSMLDAKIAFMDDCKTQWRYRPNAPADIETVMAAKLAAEKWLSIYEELKAQAEYGKLPADFSPSSLPDQRA